MGRCPLALAAAQRAESFAIQPSAAPLDRNIQTDAAVEALSVLEAYDDGAKWLKCVTPSPQAARFCAAAPLPFFPARFASSPFLPLLLLLLLLPCVGAAPVFRLQRPRAPLRRCPAANRRLLHARQPPTITGGASRPAAGSWWAAWWG